MSELELDSKIGMTESASSPKNIVRDRPLIPHLDMSKINMDLHEVPGSKGTHRRNRTSTYFPNDEVINQPIPA